MPFRFLDHTGDVGIELEAESAAGLFREGARAFAAILTDATAIAEVEERELRLVAGGLDLLLRDFLEELLWLFESEGFLPATATAEVAEVAGGLGLVALVRGELRDPTRHALRLLFKAVTYHGLVAEERDGGFVARVIFDI